ncbi:MAG: anthranilate synthase component I [Hyphomicrobiales bacterium]|jgi:anthranilate synthase component 1|nr:anthranilate synthase component I [Hyphomicrobiales bacterium]
MGTLPEYHQFEEHYLDGEPQLIRKTLVGDLETPVSAFLKLTAGDRRHAILLESVEGGSTRGRYSIIGLKPDLIWRCRDGEAEINRNALLDRDHYTPCGKPPLTSLREVLAESMIAFEEGLPPMSAGMFGYLGYDMVRQMERLPDANPDALGVPDAILMRPMIMVIFDSVKDEITVVTPVRPKAGVSPRAAYEMALERIDTAHAALEGPLPAGIPLPAGLSTLEHGISNTTEPEFLSMVEKAKDYIRAGDIFQVVLSQRFDAPFALPPFALYRALRRVNPSPYLSYLDFDGFQIVCSSPEILVRVRKGQVTIRPIAGTRPRGKTEAEDRALGQELLADEKECAEHLMLLDLGRNDVGRVAKTGTVEVTGSFFLEHYSHVMHIVSNVEGVLDEKYDVIDALAAGFPAGTVSGAPKIRAMQIIDELEREKRGPYGGCIGYFGANGEMDTCIVLRTAIVKDGKMHVQAGAGIVYDSNPKSEQQECIAKSKALFRAADEAVRFAFGAKRGQ